MHSPICLSFYYYICHLFNLLRIINFLFSGIYDDAMRYSLMKEKCQAVCSLAWGGLMGKFLSDSAGLWQITLLLRTELCIPTSISLNRSPAFSPPHCDMRIIFSQSGIMVVKSFWYSQEKNSPLLLFFIDSGNKAQRNPVPFYCKYY